LLVADDIAYLDTRPDDRFRSAHSGPHAGIAAGSHAFSLKRNVVASGRASAPDDVIPRRTSEREPDDIACPACRFSREANDDRPACLLSADRSRAVAETSDRCAQRLLEFDTSPECGAANVSGSRRDTRPPGTDGTLTADDLEHVQ
jgi:hypothetical protein